MAFFVLFGSSGFCLVLSILDSFCAVLYGLFGYKWTLLLSRSLNVTKIPPILFKVFIFAAIFDLLENLTLSTIILLFPNKYPFLVHLAQVLNYIKFLVLAIGISLLLYLLFKKITAR
jgi:uncharacterized protein involved in cysteine biosynthesis